MTVQAVYLCWSPLKGMLWSAVCVCCNSIVAVCHKAFPLDTLALVSFRFVLLFLGVVCSLRGSPSSTSPIRASLTAISSVGWVSNHFPSQRVSSLVDQSENQCVSSSLEHLAPSPVSLRFGADSAVSFC